MNVRRLALPMTVLFVASMAEAAPARAPARSGAQPASKAPRRGRASVIPRRNETDRFLDKLSAPVRDAVKKLGGLPSAEEAPPPAGTDPDRDRILRLQEALSSIVHGPTLRRLGVGVSVVDLASGRMLFGRGATTLMDPASNQKVLATATALLRLGTGWRFRTEVTAQPPDEAGVISGDVFLRGSGDPSLRAGHLEALAAQLAARGVTRVEGGVLADPRRIGSSETVARERSPIRVGGSAIEIRVRPGHSAGAPPEVIVRPATDAFIVQNRATTRAKGRSRVRTSLSTSGGRIQIVVTGRISKRHPGMVLRRVPPNQSLYAAALLRAALLDAGIEVLGPAGVGAPDGRQRQALQPAPERLMFARAAIGLDTVPDDRVSPPVLLAVHDSAPLPVIIRRINKNSDNEWAERLLETVGAEVYGGAATPEKGIRALREAITELGLPPSAYVPVNGSGLGHRNRITADAMAEILRKVYLDPRLGPDMLQSLSVGGVDGTTRNRFRGSPAAERVRSKTGTLNGKSILSGYVGDGSDILVFSIMVQGMRARSVAGVRGAQVNAVNAMMRYARGAVGPTPVEEIAPPRDFENGNEIVEIDEGTEDGADDAPPPSEEKLNALLDEALKRIDGR